MIILMRCKECGHEEYVDVKARSLNKVLLLIQVWLCAKCRVVTEDALDRAFWAGLE